VPDYLVLGDDVVIRDYQVAMEYINLMTSLGVEISHPKTVVARHQFCSVEFASRLFCNGIEYSPLPVGAILLAKERVISTFAV
jgi:hypothetical protein